MVVYGSVPEVLEVKLELEHGILPCDIVGGLAGLILALTWNHFASLVFDPKDSEIEKK